jgi:hypothetical protein
MLARMNYKRRKLTFTPLHLCHDGRNLHKVRPRADNVDNFEHYS